MLETPWWKKLPENEQNTQKRRKVNLYSPIVTNVDDFEKDIPEKWKKPNQSGKQNVAAVCGDDDEENEDMGVTGLIKTVSFLRATNLMMKREIMRI